MEQEEKYGRRIQPQVIIKCPHCGWEYTPGEIFYPEDAVGQASNVIRDPLGKIIYVEYDDDDHKPLAEEHFYCEHCDKPFIVTLELKCGSKFEEEELDFSETQTQLW